MTRSGAASGHAGYYHETAFYGSDEELLAVTMPFLEGGRSAGEPTLVTLNDRNTALVRAALDDHDGIDFLPAVDQYARPTHAIASYRAILSGYVAAGAIQIRVVGDVPHPGTGADWPAWLRYEAAVTRALDDFPLWGLCPYDTRITPDDVLEDVGRLHPHVATTDGDHHTNDRFDDPVSYVRSRLRGRPHTLEAAAPAVALDDVVAPAAVRRAVVAVAADTLLDDRRVDDLVMSASEVVTNALRHGQTPVDVRIWADAGAVVCQVVDRGSGPADPLVGLLAPPEGSEGGYGLWVANHVCDRVDLDVADEGFAVRLVMEAPAPS